MPDAHAYNKTHYNNVEKNNTRYQRSYKIGSLSD